MLEFIQLLHVFLCFFLILIILLQPGKDSGAVFGGQSGNSTYTARSNANPLGRATTIVAVVFMMTSITLAFYSTPDAKEGSNVTDRTQELAKKIAKDDLEFTVPKLPNLQPTKLMKPVVAPPIIEVPVDNNDEADATQPAEQ